MDDALPFQRSAIRPMLCLREAWQLVRDQYGLFLGITLVGLLISGAVPFGILMGPMMCGMAKCFLAKRRGETVKFDLLFKGFDHFSESLIASMLIFGASLLVLLPVMLLIMFGGLFAAFSATSRATPGFVVALVLAGMGLLLVVLLSMLIGALFAFTFPLIADRGMKGTEALKLGAKAALANLGGLLGLGILTFLISCAGLCCCYVGVFLVAPLTMGAQFIAYEQVFGRIEVTGE
jgi:hypothetical protein